MNDVLKMLPVRDSIGRQPGIYSVCSAHPLVIEAAMRQCQQDGTPLLIEATCNQVNQFGGYTGMGPAGFVQFVRAIADRLDFDADRLIFGGDHLGPNPWRDQPATEAMALAKDLLRAYAAAGFKKLHLDASMACAGDPAALPDETVAQRAAALCQAAEEVAPGVAVYVVGTEVPVPGGATEELSQIQVTSPAAAKHTLEAHEAAFASLQLQDAWSRVIGLVVQPGVEFDHTRVFDYQPEHATALSAFQKAQHKFVFEAHSTDYQRCDLLAKLVDDGFAILKVGPGLTFALREALYMLELIEKELVPKAYCSDLRAVVEADMMRLQKDWGDYYHGDPVHQAQMRVFSYSDRVRYYWGQPAIAGAVQRLLDNLKTVAIPENLVSQYMPGQYEAYRLGAIGLSVHELLMERIRAAIRPYATACIRIK
jgi:D-tagatose-1,6-bisphosphate aldolase subunit GatZ/KbaZ